MPAAEALAARALTAALLPHAAARPPTGLRPLAGRGRAMAGNEAAPAEASPGRLMAGKRVLLTGGTSGIGRHTALQLVRRGASLLLHGRSPERTVQAADELRAAVPGADVRPFPGYDLSLLADAKRLAADVAASEPHLDVLLQNAGVFEKTRRVTPDGFEATWAVNVAAPFVIAAGLAPALAAAPAGRIVNVASISHSDMASLRERPPRMDFEDLQSHKNFDAYAAYGQSKFALVCLTFAMSRRLRAMRARAVANCLDPGTVNTQMLLKGWGRCGIEVEDADDELFLASDPSVEGLTGKYFVGSRETRAVPLAYDEAVQERLWAGLAASTGIDWPAAAATAAAAGGGT